MAADDPTKMPLHNPHQGADLLAATVIAERLAERTVSQTAGGQSITKGMDASAAKLLADHLAQKKVQAQEKAQDQGGGSFGSPVVSARKPAPRVTLEMPGPDGRAARKVVNQELEAREYKDTLAVRANFADKERSVSVFSKEKEQGTLSMKFEHKSREVER